MSITPEDFPKATFNQRPLREFELTPDNFALWLLDLEDGDGICARYTPHGPVTIRPTYDCAILCCPCCNKKSLLIRLTVRDDDTEDEWPAYISANVPPDVVFKTV